MSPDLAAALFAALMALVFAAGFGACLWLDISAQIDEATRLPHHRPAAQRTPLDDDTTRIDPANVIDLRRARTTFEETA